jgi:hypothetical protein
MALIPIHSHLLRPRLHRSAKPQRIQTKARLTQEFIHFAFLLNEQVNLIRSDTGVYFLQLP